MVSELVVALSYFDRKVGPTVFIEIPEKLSEEVKMVLNQVFDQTTSEGFFWHSLGGGFTTSLNYYFEIKSDWARGAKEMLMCSLIFKEKLEGAGETEVIAWVVEFIQKMRNQPDSFKAFYVPQKFNVDQQSQETPSDNPAIEIYFTVQKWLKDLYYSVMEQTRNRTEEEIIANFMVDEAIYNVIRTLSKYPIKIDELKSWFKERGFSREFDKIISELEKQKFIFINNIGHETYVLLVKDVGIVRVPPACVMEMIDRRDEEPQVILEHYIEIVSEYFNSYDPINDDQPKLYSFLARPKHYNLITELRKGPLLKSKLTSILRQGPVVASKINVVEELKEENVIDEFETDEDVYVFLKTDINLRIQFPEYIQKAIPQDKQVEATPKSAFQKVKLDLLDLFGGSGGDLGEDYDRSDVSDGVTRVVNEMLPSDEILNELGENSPFDQVFDEMTSKFGQNADKEKNEEPEVPEKPGAKRNNTKM